MNTGDTERLFSGFGHIHTRYRNRLLPSTVHKVAVVRTYLHRLHVAAGLVVNRLKRKLTADVDKPSDPSPSSTSGTSIVDNDDELHDGGAAITDFAALSTDLIEQAIQSRERFEAEDTDDSEEPTANASHLQAGLNTTPAAALRPSILNHPAVSSPFTLPPPNSTRLSTPGQRSVRSQAKNTYIPLAQLFLFPQRRSSADISNVSIASTSTSASSITQSSTSDLFESQNTDRLRRLQFIWTTGVRNMTQEAHLSELLQPTN